jgi:transcription elongation factor GreA
MPRESKDASANLITAEGLSKLNEELAALEDDGRRQIAEQIRTAREWGDLSENAEYHAAKNDQAHLETKIRRLREKIATAVVVEEGSEGGAGGAGVVAFGSSVRVRDEHGAEHEWKIVSSHEGAPAEGLLSAESPVAVALIGRAVGERASVALPRGRRSFEILSVS